MGRFVKGDVVVVPFPFSDLSNAKRRPSLVVADLEGDDVILCQITSKNVKDRYAIKIKDDDFEEGSLRAISNVRPNRIFTADEHIILYKVGHLSKEKVETIVEAIVMILKS